MVEKKKKKKKKKKKTRLLIPGLRNPLATRGPGQAASTCMTYQRPNYTAPAPYFAYKTS
jgi:hypothetical protein